MSIVRLGSWPMYVSGAVQKIGALMRRGRAGAAACGCDRGAEVEAAGPGHLEEAGEVLLVARRDVARRHRLFLALHAAEARADVVREPAELAELAVVDDVDAQCRPGA